MHVFDVQRGSNMDTKEHVCINIEFKPYRIPCMLTVSGNEHADKIILYFHPVGEDVGLCGGFLRPICDAWGVGLKLLGSRGRDRVSYIWTIHERAGGA